MSTATVTVVIPLPCGCRLEQALNTEGGDWSAKTVARLFESVPGSLGYWAILRTQWHRCDLVAPDNRNGFDREAFEASKN